MKNEILTELQKPFKLKARKGVGGQTFYYVPSDDVVERMNNVFRGNWSTEVLSITEKEGYILAHVRVSALDPETKNIFHHEGFAGQYIARYTEGPRKGQVVDIGNSYKAAISKAIKVACSRWGVGLRLDPELSDVDGDTTGVGVSETTPSTPPNNNLDIPDLNQPTNTNNTIDTTFSKPVSTEVNLNPEIPIVEQPSEMPLETTPTPVSDEQIPVTDSTPSVLPDIPENVSESFDMPTDMEPPNLTPVQETAITILMDQYGLSYEELAKKALGRDTFPPLKELEYKDAVKILQYGNNLK